MRARREVRVRVRGSKTARPPTTGARVGLRVTEATAMALMLVAVGTALASAEANANELRMVLTVDAKDARDDDDVAERGTITSNETAQEKYVANARPEGSDAERAWPLLASTSGADSWRWRRDDCVDTTSKDLR